MIELVKEIWQTMCTNKLRTALTGLSVAWGVFMLILLLAISNGVIKSFEQRAMNDDPYIIDVWGGTTTMPYQGLKDGRDIQLSERYYDAVQAGDRGHISSVSGISSFTTTISTDREYTTADCRGIMPENMRGDNILEQGRSINHADVKEARKVMVLPRKVAENLFKDPDHAVGSIVKASSLAFTVIGVYSHEWRDDIYIPVTTAKALNGYDDKVGRMQINITNVVTADDAKDVERSIYRSMGAVAHFNPDDENALWMHDHYSNMLEAFTGLRILNITMWVIGILTLITGIVGVSNIMFVSVRERTHEIGIRRAIGAKPASILRQIVIESVAMTTVFGYIGIVMGTAATELVKIAFAGSDFMMSPGVDINIALEVTIALIIAGALAGVFPAVRATKVKPVEALRDE